MTNINGDNITWNGDNFDKQFTYDIPAEYNASKMHVVAFVAPKLGNSAIPMTELVVNQPTWLKLLLLQALKMQAWTMVTKS